MSYGTAGGSLKPVIALGFWESFFGFLKPSTLGHAFVFLALSSAKVAGCQSSQWRAGSPLAPFAWDQLIVELYMRRLIYTYIYSNGEYKDRSGDLPIPSRARWRCRLEHALRRAPLRSGIDGGPPSSALSQ